MLFYFSLAHLPYTVNHFIFTLTMNFSPKAKYTMQHIALLK